ncbi:hypothetical protein AALP_AA4G260700 [Arabis alpina]|uniref:Uncharacterized protein n=1 Tax=Arabis alpina TaxID=50452 RepID=A0A087H5R5_ARAAL|nr:hypothetical protein AALP_AA4G260700 [Arabis alpina]
MAGLRKLDGKIVIISGGASGIGAEAVRLFTDHGAKVVILDLQEELGQNLAVSVGQDKSTFYRCDITNETEVENAVKFTVESMARHVAEAALFLASDDSAYVSGQNLAVDGGFSVVKPMAIKLEGKIVIITGGASGIGAEAVRLFTDHGAKVVILDLQEELGQNVAVAVGLDKACFYRCDITNETEVENAVKFTVENYGKLDVMFSNAGVMEMLGSFLDLDLEMFDRTMAVNVRGAAACIKHAARAMVEKGTRGSIVCTTSVASEIGGSGPHAYTASKYALLGLVKSACGGLGKYGIRVNGVAPYGLSTGMTSHDEESVKFVEGYCAATAILKDVVLKTRHVAEAALFLASDDSAYVSGQNLAVDGGFSVVKPMAIETGCVDIEATGYNSLLSSRSESLSSARLWTSCWRGLHPGWLLFTRSISLLSMAALLAWDVFEWDTSIFVYYTEWTFMLVLLYFAMGIVASTYGCLEYSKEPTLECAEEFRQRLRVYGCFMETIFQTSAGAVVLTDVVFWLVIVPFLSDTHLGLNTLMICMHSTNAGFLLIDTLLNGIPFPWFRISYFVLWSCIYIIFQWIIHACGFTWWPYPFLELDKPLEPLWYLCMTMIHIPCYGAYAAIVIAKNSCFQCVFPNAFVKL